MKRYHILSIDELGITRLELSGMLKNLNIGIASVKNGLEAASVLAEKKPKFDAVIWTVNSIDFDPFEALEGLRSEETYRKIPVLIISKLTNQKFITKAIEAGASEFIVKPYDEETVLKKICKTLGIFYQHVYQHKFEDDIIFFNLEDMLNREIKSASRGCHDLSILLISAVPDKTVPLRADESEMLMDLMNKILRNKLRETDSTFLYRGSNVILLLPFTDKDGIKTVVERVEKVFLTNPLICQKNRGYHLVSASVIYPTDGKIKDDILENLERMLEDNIQKIENITQK